ncbi:MAG TPA: hypothetical protein VK530_14245 [Candidatus Acidoferrum sp.]|nr:hypothetical protein [Candidatus Acidoferrum sp.]
MKYLWVALLLPALCFAAADSSSFEVGGFTFKRPAKWESVQPASTMRKAQLRVPGPKQSESADVIFFHFGPGDGGGTQANIDRWFMQFKDAKDKKSTGTKVGKHKVIYVSTHGTYSGGMPGQPAAALPDYALLGAIIEKETGNVFIKMTGPAEVVKSADGEFRQMVEGAMK